MKLTGNTILITGGARGIGLELTKQLHRAGNTIIITGRDAKNLEKVKAALPDVHTIQSDISSAEQIAKLHKQVTKDFPALNVLINNAGIMREINFYSGKNKLEDLTEEIDINLSGVIRMVAQFLPHLKSKPLAAIANVTSGLAFVPLPVAPVYCATKAALHSFTMSLRVQLKTTNVKVFELAPPATKTELLDAAHPDDMKGVPIMSVESMVAACVKGMAADKFEIRPGPSNQLKIMSRVAPDFILKMLSRSVDRMLAEKV